jgi:hypothetical protein
MSLLKVDSITDRNNAGSPSLPFGATIPSGTGFDILGNINVSGIATVGIISATGAVVSGVVTATSFVGDGSGLTGLQSVSAGKSIALKILLDPLPFRS